LDIVNNDSVPIYPSTESEVYAGDVFWLNIYVGTPSIPVAHLYGVSFVVIYDINWIQPDLSIPENEMMGDLLGFSDELKILFPNLFGDSLATAISRIDTNKTASGNGILMRIRFTSKKSTPNFTKVCFHIRQVSAVDSAWNTIELVPQDFCMQIIRPPGVKPNPFTPNDDGYNDRVEFNLKELIEYGGEILIFDIWGHKVRQIENGIIWNGKDDSGNNLLPGSYLYIVKSQGSLIDKGVIGLAR